MRWPQVFADIWRLPASNTKTGLEHIVYLGPMSRALIEAQPRMNETDLVFAGRGGCVMSGFSKMLAPLKESLRQSDFGYHTLRRTYRTGLSTLGVPFDVAELAIAHKRGDLHGRYDKSTLENERRAAQAKWEAYVAKAVKGC